MNPRSTVLIADDDPAVCDTLEALLINEGYNLAFANNGAEALARAAELTPDLVLLDVNMPVMDGFEVCQRLRADPRLAEVPIIIVTALLDSDSRLLGIRAGADDFVSKPFDRVELRARVRTIIRLNRYRRLLAERARFAWVVEQADEGYLSVGDQDRVLYANRQARLYLGQPEDTSLPIAQGFLELARKQYRDEPQAAWAGWPAQLAADGPGPRYLVRPETPTAKAFWLQVDVLDLPSGAELARLVRLRDVTAQMASQRDMWKFHRVVFHKLRTPLISILGGLELLAQHTSKLTEAEIAHFSQISIKGAQRLRGEIEDILKYLNAPTLAQAGAGFMLSQLEPVVGEICARLGLETARVSTPASLADARLALSQPAVEAVLWEILENTKKFHPRQAPAVEIRASHAGADEVKIQVYDDGVTLSPDQLSKVWFPYYQGEKYFTGEATGMGLGLPMVASLVWEAGGTCGIRNREEGPGVVMDIILPLAKEQPAAARGQIVPRAPYLNR